MSNPAFYCHSDLFVGLCRKRKTWIAEYGVDTNHGYTIYDKITKISQEEWVTINRIRIHTDGRDVKVGELTRTVAVACKLFNTTSNEIISEHDFDHLWGVYSV